MISSTLVTLSHELRQAAARRAYADVERLALRLSKTADAEIRSLPGGDPAVREVAAWTKELFDRTATLLRIARASHTAELRRVTFLQRYLRCPDRRAGRVKMAL